MIKEDTTLFTLFQKVYSILMEDRYCCGNIYDDLHDLKPQIKEALDAEEKAMHFREIEHKHNWWK